MSLSYSCLFFLLFFFLLFLFFFLFFFIFFLLSSNNLFLSSSLLLYSGFFFNSSFFFFSWGNFFFFSWGSLFLLNWGSFLFSSLEYGYIYIRNLRCLGQSIGLNNSVAHVISNVFDIVLLAVRGCPAVLSINGSTSFTFLLMG